MFLANTHADFGAPLLIEDAEMLSLAAAGDVERHFSQRQDHRPTPLHALPALAKELGVAGVFVKDEGHRLGLGSFKALGGSYAVIRLVIEEAERHLGRGLGLDDFDRPEVRAVAAGMTFGCATDGNHGRSVAMGAELVGAKSVIFVHAGVSEKRIEAIARYGAEIVRVAGTYDDSVAEAARVCEARGWTVVSDTSWPGYEYIPGLVMQGYTALLCEALRQMDQPPTHVFVQAGVGGIAAATAGHLALRYGDDRPRFVVVDPARAACLYESAKAGHPIKVQHGEPTIMAMLECYEPSLVAWRILSRVADAFMTVDEEDAVSIMNRLARPVGGDPAIVAGESGGVGLAGLVAVARDPVLGEALGLTAQSRVFVINTEGATDPERYAALVGLTAETVADQTSERG
ncbi:MULTISPECIES: diaminopropionate ammonia-lyase [unclassified Ensifer]|uniref:diaminopropionate ammonia-lyase n=1 Tax=unclassified Ensifer TaxID=2633371 RepID=UPI000813A1EE|nr:MULTISPECIES: diaminopropionate ammonia-lyase [unclassified Ensifer]OCP02692.1 diaminopropionate ammonia-lyase [Ensifer sp. LC14]OCP13593.1 diaminopropionate ammonia-lyase [Ensifer sp. LC13]OCP14253.1 diaminopropionate ammonia-lyase [Ensifer sp. LC11]OCP28956.1 diaminopropionate ammonia-lyase [Ensifer sp. LC499]